MLRPKIMESMDEILRDRKKRACEDLVIALRHFNQPDIAEVLDCRQIRGLDSVIEQFLAVLEQQGWDLEKKCFRKVGENGK